jgi:hypothetical protein
LRAAFFESFREWPRKSNGLIDFELHMSLFVGMELVDLPTAIIVAAMIIEVSVRINLNKKAVEVLAGAEPLGRTVEGPMNLEVELKALPWPPNEWSPGLGSFLSARPMLIFFVLIIGLAGVLSAVGLIMTVPKLILAVLAIAIGIAFHSGPDRYTLSEYFIQISIKAEIESLSDRQLRLLSLATYQMKSWAFLQLCFAVGLLAGVLIPMDWAANYVLGLSLLMFIILGYVYQIQKGIFAGPT